MIKKEAMELAARELARDDEEVLDATPVGQNLAALITGPQGHVVSAARINVLLGKNRALPGEPFRVIFDHNTLASAYYDQILEDLQ